MLNHSYDNKFKYDGNSRAIWIAAVRECITEDAAERLINGDMSATDEAGHQLIADECSRIAATDRGQQLLRMEWDDTVARLND